MKKVPTSAIAGSTAIVDQGNSNYPLFPWWKQWYVAPYLQDDWKISRRLTLNLGLRWDFLSPQYEKWSRQNGPFDPSAATPISAVVFFPAKVGGSVPTTSISSTWPSSQA